MSLLSEFKEFAVRGNVVDMAVGIVIGTAFGKIVSSLVADIIMPPVGVLLGNVDFSELSVTLKEGVDGADPITLNYGLFINSVLDFVIVAFAIFIVIKQMNRLKRPAPAPAVTTKACPYCQMEIPLAASRCGHCTSQL